MFNVRFNMPTPNRRYKALREESSRFAIMKAMRDAVVLKLSGWIFRRSKSRHKTANKFGVKPTGILEFAESSPTSYSRGGGKIFSQRKGESNSIFISGIPFIQKAFRDLNITPKKASALTIPLHRDAVRTPARQIASKGWNTFIPRGKSYIAGKKGNSKKIVPLYALSKSVRIPRDARLLPPAHLMDYWAKDAIIKELSNA